jgi:hypothetical protein
LYDIACNLVAAGPEAGVGLALARGLTGTAVDVAYEEALLGGPMLVMQYLSAVGRLASTNGLQPVYSNHSIFPNAIRHVEWEVVHLLQQRRHFHRVGVHPAGLLG